MDRFILTGTPGSGKTSIIRTLAARRFSVVEEAATDVIARAQARGNPEPWTQPSFIDDIATLQRERQIQASGPGPQFHDRSPLCTYALSVHLGFPISATLSGELERIEQEAIYRKMVFFIRNLGFCEPTEARRISFEESLKFEALHEKTYRAFGYALIDIPPAPVETRADLIEHYFRFASGT